MNFRLSPRAAILSAAALCLALLAPLALSAAPCRAISFEAMPVLSASEASLSPDGRWLASIEELRSRNRGQRTRIVFTDLRSRRAWPLDVTANFSEVYDYANPPWLRWSPDSRACFVHSGEGWSIAYPQRRRTRLISRTLQADGVAWAPRSQRLAFFAGGGGPLRIWDGRRLLPERDWVKSTGYPYAGDVRVWQVEWSPDERTILVRFYGHAERESDNAGHTYVFSARTGRALYNWGDEARPAAWLDSRRLIYLGDTEGMMGPADLVVSRPNSRQAALRRSVWLRDVVNWTLSGDKATIWALRKNGDLMRTSARFKKWRLVRNISPASTSASTSTPTTWSIYLVRMAASPRGDVLALSQFDGLSGGRGLSLLSTGQRPWLTAWSAPRGTVEILGWRPGQALPLLNWKPSEGAPAQIIQLKW